MSKDPIDQFLEKNRNYKLKIDCVGDAMVDIYQEVTVNRISPEFPMPIMKVAGKQVRKPGGVANVEQQLKYFNVDTRLFCFNDGSFPCTDCTTEINAPYETGHLPVKQRYLEGDIQITRYDDEYDNYRLTDEQIAEKRKLAYDSFANKEPADVVILSDYNKGFFSPEVNWVDYLNKMGIKSVVDPKTNNLSQWKGCTVFKPNAKEAADLSGYSYYRDQVHFFQDRLDCEAVVITHSGEGVFGIWGSDYFEFIPIEEVNVRSSVGAGDCFIAFLAMAVGHGFVRNEAIEIAYSAGEQYVQGIKNQPISPAQLSDTKIVHPEDLKNRPFTLAFTNGCYDILHSGHLHTLNFASDKADKLVVAVNSDESVKRLKGPERPIKNLSERMGLLASLEMVDFVVSFDEDTPLETIKKCTPDALIKGADYGPGQIVGEDIVPETFRVPLVKGKSTTNLIKGKFL